MRFNRSRSLVEATGYMVLSGKVMAFRKVCMEVFSKLTKGSFTGNFSDPHSTECSKMWKTPVSSAAGVLKLMEKALLASSLARYMSRAPEATWVMRCAVPSISGRSSLRSQANPWRAVMVLVSVIAVPFLCVFRPYCTQRGRKGRLPSCRRYYFSARRKYSL